MQSEGWQERLQPVKHLIKNIYKCKIWDRGLASHRQPLHTFLCRWSYIGHASPSNATWTWVKSPPQEGWPNLSRTNARQLLLRASPFRAVCHPATGGRKGSLWGSSKPIGSLLPGPGFPFAGRLSLRRSEDIHHGSRLILAQLSDTHWRQISFPAWPARLMADSNWSWLSCVTLWSLLHLNSFSLLRQWRCLQKKGWSICFSGELAIVLSNLYIF